MDWCGLPCNVIRSTSASKLLRNCINFEEAANFPAAWPIPCVRFTDAVSPSSNLFGFWVFVGNAVPSATFHDLANICATLGSNYWLGFITTGLSPDKKRHALHGAQRFSAPNPTDSAHFQYFYHVPPACQSVTHQRGRIWVARLYRTTDLFMRGVRRPLSGPLPLHSHCE